MLVTNELIEKMLGKEAPAGRGGDSPVQGATLVTSMPFLPTVHLEFCDRRTWLEEEASEVLVE